MTTPENTGMENKTLLDYFDFSLMELYSLEEMLESFGQHQMADVLRSVVEMAYGKLNAIEELIQRDLGQVQVSVNERGEAIKVFLAAKPQNESIQ